MEDNYNIGQIYQKNLNCLNNYYLLIKKVNTRFFKNRVFTFEKVSISIFNGFMS